MSVGTGSKKQNLGVMKPQTMDYKYEDIDVYKPDPMGMGGNSELAKARKEAALHGYQKVSGLTNFGTANSGLGAL